MVVLNKYKAMYIYFTTTILYYSNVIRYHRLRKHPARKVITCIRRVISMFSKDINTRYQYFSWNHILGLTHFLPFYNNNIIAF